MPAFSKKSKKNLDSCHHSLRYLFTAIIKRVDCTILEGRRSKYKQNKAYDEGRSKLQYPLSKHNSDPSKAVDVGPYDATRKKVPWPDESVPKSVAKLIPSELFEALEVYIKDQCLWYRFIGYVQGTADQMGIDIRSGDDWDMDWSILDQQFDDLPHHEVVVKGE